jgi:hypothetical protein
LRGQGSNIRRRTGDDLQDIGRRRLPLHALPQCFLVGGEYRFGALVFGDHRCSHVYADNLAGWIPQRIPIILPKCRKSL